MAVQIDGTYEDGKVTLASVPAGVVRARVVVTFVDEPARATDAPRQAPVTGTEGPAAAKSSFASLYGMFPGPYVTNEDDFKAAEWHPKKEDLDV